jgi:hypothetical protein
MPLDTSAEAARIQAEAQRKLGPARRLRIALEMSAATHELVLARIRAKNPELSPREARERLVWELYGVRRDAR